MRDPLTQSPEELLCHHQWKLDMPWQPTLIHPRLWLGGTPDADTLLTAQANDLGESWSPSANANDYDAVVTLAASVGPAGTGVREYRAGLIDRDGGTPSQELVLEAVHMTVAWYQDGLRVLVRCRAGMNRSGLIAALALTELTDMTYDQAVQHLRRTRGRYVLYNPMLYSFGKTLNQNT